MPFSKHFSRKYVVQHKTTVFAPLYARIYILIMNGRARTIRRGKMKKNAKKMLKNLRMSKKSSTFAPAFDRESE